VEVVKPATSNLSVIVERSLTIKAWMGLSGRGEVRFDAQMYFHAVGFEPASTSRRQNVENRLRNRSRRALKPIRIRKSQYLNNRIEQDHRRIKRRTRSMLGFKSMASAEVILSGI